MIGRWVLVGLYRTATTVFDVFCEVVGGTQELVAGALDYTKEWTEAEYALRTYNPDLYIWMPEVMSALAHANVDSDELLSAIKQLVNEVPGEK